MSENSFEYKKILTEWPATILAKWPKDILDEGFVPFPKKILRNLHKIFPNNPQIEELCAILSVADFKRDKLTRQPSSDYLGFIAGMDSQRFEKIIKRLEELKLVEANRKALIDEIEINYEGFLNEVRKFSK